MSTGKEIERRSEVLIELGLSLWPYFGPHQDAADIENSDEDSVKGTVPSVLKIRGRSVVVQSWAEVGVQTMEGIVEMGEQPGPYSQFRSFPTTELFPGSMRFDVYANKW